MVGFIAPTVDYTMEALYSITEICPHVIAEIRTLTAECGCETTVLVCIDCGKQLSDPKTEC